MNLPTTRSDEEIERDAVDLITHAMYSLAFLKSVSDNLEEPAGQQVSMRQFYDLWHQETGRTEQVVPFSLGSILGYLYVGILFAKEKWYELIPDVPYHEASRTWGFPVAMISDSKVPTPTLRDVVRRVRNGLGHGRVDIVIPKEGISKANVLEKVTVVFKDLRGPTNTFECSLPLGEAVSFVRQFQSVIHKTMREKYKVV